MLDSRVVRVSQTWLLAVPVVSRCLRYLQNPRRTESFTLMDEMVPKFLEPVQNGDADICLGSQLEEEIRDGSIPPLHKCVGNALLMRFLNTFYGAGVTDNSGFSVLTKDALETLELETTGTKFASSQFCVHMLEHVPFSEHSMSGCVRFSATNCHSLRPTLSVPFEYVSCLYSPL